jgi:hypothetical protein
MKLFLVCGPWSSGTTAVSGVLNFLEIKSIPPFFRTNDEKTKNTYESILFRNILLDLASEKELKKIKDKNYIESKLNNLKVLINEHDLFVKDSEKILFLKHPLACLFILELASIFDIHLIYVLRPMRNIEKTRIRRKWKPEFGLKGAQIIYSHMFNILINHNLPTLMIKYDNLLKNPSSVIKQLIKFTSSSPSEKSIQQAIDYIKK